MKYYKCLTPNPFSQLLTYSSELDIANGTQVLLPYASKTVYGIVWEKEYIPELAKEKIKNILEIQEHLIPQDMIIWFEWVAQYYHIPLVRLVTKTLASTCWNSITPLSASYTQYYNSYYTLATEGGILLQEKIWNLKQLKTAHNPSQQESYLKSPFQLTNSQRQALENIQNTFQVTILDGPTGSGKTEVYLELLCKYANKYPVLLMMPEITLTKNMIHRLTTRLGRPPWVYHSNLNKNVKNMHWLAASQNTAGLWIGTRSSAFLPAQWKMVIIDEEHDASYTQTQNIYYSAKHIMLMRAKMLNCPIILGSATPSLESLKQASSGKYQILKLEKTYHAPIKINIIDAKRENMQNGISSTVNNAISKHLQKKHQVLIFLNRRGYSPVLFCKICGWKSECQNCDAHMTVHLEQKQLRCHHCDTKITIPETCPNQHINLLQIGYGTQRLEEYLRLQYPSTKLIRIDQDNKNNDELEEILSINEPAIIIGTQIITKGIDAPHIRCVVIAQLDNQLLNTDYYSNERAYQLVTQVMGRAARRARSIIEDPDELWVQTYFPEHPLWEHLINNKITQYPKLLLTWRQKQSLPPFTYVCQIKIADKNEKKALDNIKIFRKKFIANISNQSIKLYGPFASIVNRKKKLFHYTGTIIAHKRQDIDNAMIIAREILSQSKITWSLERDSQES